MVSIDDPKNLITFRMLESDRMVTSSILLSFSFPKRSVYFVIYPGIAELSHAAPSSFAANDTWKTNFTRIASYPSFWYICFSVTSSWILSRMTSIVHLIEMKLRLLWKQVDLPSALTVNHLVAIFNTRVINKFYPIRSLSAENCRDFEASCLKNFVDAGII